MQLIPYRSMSCYYIYKTFLVAKMQSDHKVFNIKKMTTLQKCILFAFVKTRFQFYQLAFVRFLGRTNTQYFFLCFIFNENIIALNPTKYKA